MGAQKCLSADHRGASASVIAPDRKEDTFVEFAFGKEDAGT